MLVQSGSNEVQPSPLNGPGANERGVQELSDEDSEKVMGGAIPPGQVIKPVPPGALKSFVLGSTVGLGLAFSSFFQGKGKVPSQAASATKATGRV